MVEGIAIYGANGLGDVKYVKIDMPWPRNSSFTLELAQINPRYSKTPEYQTPGH